MGIAWEQHGNRVKYENFPSLSFCTIAEVTREYKREAAWGARPQNKDSWV